MDLTRLASAERMCRVIQYTEYMDVINTATSSFARMLSGYSVEVHPGDSKVLDAAQERLSPGTEVFLVWIPGANPMDLVASAARLSRAGLVPVPHIGARHVESSSQLEQLVGHLAEAGVDRVLLVGGDRAQPAGPYDSGLAVMQSGVFQRTGITRVSIAGFPEGNPNIPNPALEEALRAKVRFAHDTGLELSIVTQFCFAKGIANPVRVGLAGPASVTRLLRYAVRCGIGNSLHVLTEHPSFAKLLTEKGPEPIIRDIAAQAESRNNGNLPLGIAGLHFFVFGGFDRTIDWINAERAD